MKPFVILAALLTSINFFLANSIFADFSFSVPQNSIDADQEIEATVNLSLQNQGNKTYYLEGAFKRDGGNYFFGQTWNNTDWVGYTATNDDKSLKSITTTPEGSWSGTLKVKLDITSSQFIGSGNYILKINRFTSSGFSPTSSDNEVVLAVTASPTLTPTSPASTDTLTPTPTPADSPTPTLTPTRAPTLSSTRTPTPTKKPSPTAAKEPEATIPASLLGTSSAVTPTPSSVPKTQAAGFSISNLFAFGGGLIFILGGIFIFTFLAKRKTNTV